SSILWQEPGSFLQPALRPELLPSQNIGLGREICQFNSYQEFDLVVSSVTTKLKGVAQTNLPGIGDVVWDVLDFSGLPQDKNSFFVVTNVIITKNQMKGKCPEVPSKGRLCRTDKDCEKGAWDQQSHGIQTGSCVKFDVLKKTCEVSAWCPTEATSSPPRPALLAAAENFTVLIKNNIRFPAFSFIRRNILPQMNVAYLRSCDRGNDSLCPIFRLGDIVRGAGETFSDMAVEGGVIGIQIKWDCNLDRFMQSCLPRYSFRRLDEKESNRSLYPGLNYRFVKYHMVNGVEERTLYKAFGIRFDVLVFGRVGSAPQTSSARLLSRNYGVPFVKSNSHNLTAIFLVI
uniref:P2X purinoceptor 7 n=1 Tax=Nothobranchius furzeri TaxID=105023 RepID=A0A8C6M2E6_NOTFU